MTPNQQPRAMRSPKHFIPMARIVFRFEKSSELRRITLHLPRFGEEDPPDRSSVLRCLAATKRRRH